MRTVAVRPAFVNANLIDHLAEHGIDFLQMHGGFLTERGGGCRLHLAINVGDRTMNSTPLSLARENSSFARTDPVKLYISRDEPAVPDATARNSGKIAGRFAQSGGRRHVRERIQTPRTGSRRLDRGIPARARAMAGAAGSSSRGDARHAAASSTRARGTDGSDPWRFPKPRRARDDALES